MSNLKLEDLEDDQTTAQWLRGNYIHYEEVVLLLIKEIKKLKRGINELKSKMV